MRLFSNLFLSNPRFLLISFCDLSLLFPYFQHDDSNTSSIQSEPIGHVGVTGGLFLGSPEGEEGCGAKRGATTKFATQQQPAHNHNYATLNSNNGKLRHPTVVNDVTVLGQLTDCSNGRLCS